MTKPRDKIHRGWARRLMSTGRVAGAAAQLATKQMLGADDEGGLIGERIAVELDQMKGIAMKVGQILSYFDGVLPEETHRALRKLQVGSEPVDYEVVKTVIQEAFGCAVNDVFEQFQERPIAAASIGQVHRARFRGRRVAVKVQYPGVRETMVLDVSRLKALSRIASLATAVDGPAIVDELAERFRLECDYELEARSQNAFRAAFAHDSRVVIPEAVADATRTTVLTTTWCDGSGFYDFEAHADSDIKNRAARVLLSFALRCLYGAGIINADPHPGNYLFPGGEQVVFLDFGCVRQFDSDFLDAERALVRTVIEGRRDRFREAAIATGMVKKVQGFDFDLHFRMLRHQYAPYISREFHFTKDYIRAGMEFNRPSNPNLRKIAIPPQWIWMQRLLWGLHAVLTRLDAHGTFGDELRAALDSPFEIGQGVGPAAARQPPVTIHDE